MKQAKARNGKRELQRLRSIGRANSSSNSAMGSANADDLPWGTQPPGQPSYATVKEAVERQCFKILQGEQWGYLLYKDSELEMWQEANVLRSFKNWYYWEEDYDGTIIRKPFVRRWIEDPGVLTVMRVVMDPSLQPGLVQNNKCGHPGLEYNTWSGIKAAYDPPVDMDDPEIKEILQAIRGHYLLMANHDHAVADFLELWDAWLVQRPHIKTQVALLFYGPQGCGKNRLLIWKAKHLFGSKIAGSTANMTNSLFGNHSSDYLRCLFYVIDELKDAHKHYDSLKALISEDQSNVNPKFKKEGNTTNYFNLAMTTNNENPMQIDGDDRRMAVFGCSGDRVGDVDYFKELHRLVIDNPKAPRAYYQKLIQTPINHIVGNLQAYIPKTEILERTKAMCLKPQHSFLSAVANTGLPSLPGATVDGVGVVLTKVHPNELYRDFQIYASQGGFGAVCAYNVFAMCVCKVLTFAAPEGKTDKREIGIVKDRKDGGPTYHLSSERLKTGLRKLRSYDPDAELPFTVQPWTYDRQLALRKMD